MKVSVIITTFRQPVWLQKVLWGYACQKGADFEVVIAEDDQDQRTKEVIEHFNRQMHGPIQNLVHVSHEHRGFRKCMILNRAVLAASGDYLIFTDGDCIPRQNFVATHMHLARKGMFLSGGYFKLGRKTSMAIDRREIQSGLGFDPHWLIAHGEGWSRWLVRLRFADSRWNWVMDRLTTTKATWNGCNSSTFKEYVLQVNGFDHRMQYGGLDREFGQRLENAGIKGIQIRHRAICLHLDHDRSYASAEGLAFNRSIRSQTALRKVVRTPYGIDQLDQEA
ncbi:MAG: glycosyltransferase [Sedimentisphaerales bacterium]|nr:glycosyltransferase [Sedimentisphaerales bacterium]